jgi:cobalt-zinc-cadmium efflux system membrane fusion protein
MDKTNRSRWIAVGVAMLVVGGALGFAIAKLTSNATTPQAESSEAAKADNAAAGIELPESFLTTMGIALETAERGNLSSVIQAPGTISAAPNGQAVVTARASGTVVRLNKRLGEAVKAGEVLASVQSRDAASMAAERITSKSKLELAQSELAREQSLYEQKITPRQDFEAARAQLVAAEAEFARANSAADAAGVASDGRSIAVTSPIAGTVTSTNVTLGAHVEPEMELFRVADPRFVIVEASVPAADARKILPGVHAKVTTGNGASLDAKVVSVTPTLNEQTRSATVSLSLADDNAKLTPGEFVLCRITAESGAADAVIVADEAVQKINGRDAVFVRTERGFRIVPVVVGSRSGGQAAILFGLNAGDRVATKNAFLLKAEAGKGADEEE